MAKINTACRRALEGGIGMCQSRSNYNVEIEHLLVKLLEQDNTDLTRLFKHYSIDTMKVSRELTRSIDQLKTGNARGPQLSLEILDLLRDAWALSTIDYGSYRIRSGYLL